MTTSSFRLCNSLCGKLVCAGLRYTVIQLTGESARYTLCAVSETRKEKRKSESLLVLLSRVKEPWLTEAASTENVSSHGMRVLTDRFWKRDTKVIVQSSEYELWARAKVVYCQPFSDRTFAIGLELTARTGGWIIRSSTL